MEFVNLLLSPIHWDYFSEVRNQLADNKFVLLAGFKPTSQQLYDYLGWLKKGFLFAEQRFGKDCLPAKLIFFPAPIFAKTQPDFIGYIPQLDTFAIGCLRVAYEACVESGDEWIKDAGFEYELRARDRTMLIAIEECFHRYQIKVLKRPLPKKRIICSEEDPDEPLESEAAQVLKEIMSELKIENRFK